MDSISRHSQVTNQWSGVAQHSAQPHGFQIHLPSHQHQQQQWRAIATVQPNQVSPSNRPDRSDVPPAPTTGTTDGTNEETSTEHVAAREMGQPVSPPPAPPSPLPRPPPPPPFAPPPPPPPPPTPQAPPPPHQPRTDAMHECLEDILHRLHRSGGVQLTTEPPLPDEQLDLTLQLGKLATDGDGIPPPN